VPDDKFQDIPKNVNGQRIKELNVTHTLAQRALLTTLNEAQYVAF
jgi:hypothetical protein